MQSVLNSIIKYIYFNTNNINFSTEILSLRPRALFVYCHLQTKMSATFERRCRSNGIYSSCAMCRLLQARTSAGKYTAEYTAFDFFYFSVFEFRNIL